MKPLAWARVWIRIAAIVACGGCAGNHPYQRSTGPLPRCPSCDVSAVYEALLFELGYGCVLEGGRCTREWIRTRGDTVDVITVEARFSVEGRTRAPGASIGGSTSVLRISLIGRTTATVGDTTRSIPPSDALRHDVDQLVTDLREILLQPEPRSSLSL